MKNEMRLAFLKKRSSLSLSEIQDKSKWIKERFFHMDEFKEAKTILFYVSYDNEVFTHEMIKECLVKDKVVVVPKTDVNNRTLLLSTLTSWDDLDYGCYNILEPRKEYIKELPLQLIDLMVIPGVVFDIQGNRIGHGYGYYDRLLMNKGRTHRIGLAFELQIVECILAEKHDMKVEKIVTEKRIINCF